MEDNELNDFIARYMAMWHQSDAQRRRETVASLFADDAVNLTRRFVVRGLAEIIGRVTRSHDEWVAGKGFVFRPARPADMHNHVVRFYWEMLPRGGGPLEARGLDIFVLRGDGRIQTLYQFPEPLPEVISTPSAS